MTYDPQQDSDIVQIKNIFFDLLHVSIKIFLNLNAQELSEHFQDNLTLYMTLLSYDHREFHFYRHDLGI